MALYTIPSLEYLPRYGFPNLVNGQSPLGHYLVLKVFLIAILWRRPGPGHSITFTLVPFGPLTLLTAILSLFANIESFVSGTVNVVVAPSFLNQDALSGLAESLLCSLLLYKGLPSCL